MSELPEHRMPYPTPPGPPTGEAPGGVDEPGHGTETPTPVCAHPRHELAVPANLLPVWAEWRMVDLLLAIAGSLGKAALLGQADDGGPMICVCPELDPAQALAAGGIVGLSSDAYSREAADSSVHAGTVWIVLAHPGLPPVYVYGVTEQFARSVEEKAVENQIRKEAQRGIDAISAHLAA
ncbi:hypothetical protein [Micromonospora sp. NPDC000442]|uniref:hypothetical protein n=1 Tax=Micromonospora sp. NPDC000442 TaxID=3364217 RepID=UPI0036B7F574